MSGFLKTKVAWFQWYLDLNTSGADWQPTESQLTELAKLAAARL